MLTVVFIDDMVDVSGYVPVREEYLKNFGKGDNDIWICYPDKVTSPKILNSYIINELNNTFDYSKHNYVLFTCNGDVVNRTLNLIDDKVITEDMFTLLWCDSNNHIVFEKVKQ